MTRVKLISLCVYLCYWRSIYSRTWALCLCVQLWMGLWCKNEDRVWTHVTFSALLPAQQSLTPTGTEQFLDSEALLPPPPCLEPAFLRLSPSLCSKCIHSRPAPPRGIQLPHKMTTDLGDWFACRLETVLVTKRPWQMTLGTCEKKV
jgi:hypothetical protein